MKIFDKWFDETYPSCLYRKDELRKMRDEFFANMASGPRSSAGE